MLKVDIKQRLPGFSLAVKFETDGETMGLLGASGCGKSMTLKCIAGIERPDEGHIELDGRTLFDSAAHIDLSPQKRRVGYLFQQYALFPNMTVEENIAAGCREKDREKRRSAVAGQIASMRLAGLEKKRPGELSGGEAQRAALARILINEPALLLLDEPLAALDDYLRWQVELELADAIAAFGRGAVFVSHSRDEVRRLCDSVCVLSNGKSEPKRTVSELFRAPETLAACLISGCKNFSRAELLDGGHVRALDWGIPLSMEPSAPGFDFIGIRAHHIELSAVPLSANSVPCRVRRVTDDLFSVILMLETPGGTEGWSLLRVETSPARWGELQSAETLYALLPPDKLMPLCENG